MRQVGRDEALAHIAELLDEVERGEEVVVTREGRPVLRLVPATAAARHDPEAAGEAAAAIRAFRDRLAAEGRFFTREEIRSAIDEGRRD